MGLLARGETASVDAYLTPLLRAHVAALSDALPGSRLRGCRFNDTLLAGGATISEFAMYVGTTRIVGEVLEQQSARHMPQGLLPTEC